MRILALVGIIASLIAGYTWFWFDAANRAEREVEKWAAKQAERGVSVSYDSLRTTGYPYRLNMQMDNPRIESRVPDEPAWSWTGDGLRAHALPYNLQHVIAETIGTQRFVLERPDGNKVRFEEIDVLPESARASLVWAGGRFDRLAVDIQNLEGTRTVRVEKDGEERKNRQEEITVNRLQVHTGWDRSPPPQADGSQGAAGNRAPTDPAQYLAFKLENLVWRGHKLPGLGEAMEVAQFRIRMTGAPEKLVRRRGWDDERTLRTWRTNGGTADLTDLLVDWAPLKVIGQGSFELDRKGRPKGRMDTEVRNVDAFIRALSEAGVIEDLAGDVSQVVVGFVSQAAGQTRGTVQVPIKIRSGKITLAGIQAGKVKPWIDGD